MISGLLGQDYRQYLERWLAGQSSGRADLMVFFLLRASMLAQQIGLLATNSVAQGDSREVGLDRLLESGWVIARAVKSRVWPGEASVEVAQLWLTQRWEGLSSLSGEQVSGITPMLEPAGRVVGKPLRLTANLGVAYSGSKPDAKGFILTQSEALEMLGLAPNYSDVVLPFVNGEDLMSRSDCSGSRWTVFFHDWSEERAKTYEAAYAFVRPRVLPEVRSKGRSYTGWEERWWQFWRPRSELYQAIEGKERVIALAITSRIVQPVFVSVNQVYSHAVEVFAWNDYGHFGILSSSFHWWWAVTHASTMRKDLRYTPTDCFDTFPQPESSDEIARVGRALDEHRSAMMLERSEGLTKTYNRAADPADRSSDTVQLRELHAKLDYAVAAAYSWDDLGLDHDFSDTPQGRRYTLGPTPRAEILDRLLGLNHERYHKEDRAGLHSKAKATRLRRTPKTGYHPTLDGTT